MSHRKSHRNTGLRIFTRAKRVRAILLNYGLADVREGALVDRSSGRPLDLVPGALVFARRDWALAENLSWLCEEWERLVELDGGDPFLLLEFAAGAPGPDFDPLG